MRGFLAKSAFGLFLAFFAGLVLFRAQPVSAQAPTIDAGETTGASGAGSGVGAAFKYLGVNMHNLTAEPAGKQDAWLGYLAKCNINTVRVFGLKEKGGGAAIAQTANIASKYGIKIIAALGDYANGSKDIPGSIRSDPTSWYAGGYNILDTDDDYDGYVGEAVGATRGNSGMLALELANEPHCNGFPGCFQPYVNWMTTIGGRLARSGLKVSTGMGTLDTPDNAEKGESFFTQISASQGISMMSTHWYPETDPGKEGAMEKAAIIAHQNGDDVILGEIGFACNSSPCTNSTNDEDRARQMLQKMSEFAGYGKAEGRGYDGFLYWQFSGFKGDNTANDQFSWFAVGPEDVDNPFCKAFREGVITPEDEVQPLLIYPKDSVEVGKYLSNAQVYCAPKQVFEPIDPARTPPLEPACIPAVDQAPGSPFSDKLRETLPVCNETQYPLIRSDETWSLSNMSFPLFRNQAGGISIELDLSKVSPGETFATAFERGGRPNYAPQFYLSSPETQCLNAVRYVQYVQRLCSEWAPGKPSEKCGANIEVTLQDGAQRRILELAGDLNSEGVCADFSQQVKEGTKRAMIVSSLQPYTPKVFKIGFLVHHTWLYDSGIDLLGQFLSEHLAAWFGGTEGDQEFGTKRGERVTITPIWYHAGITPDEFDQLQTKSYTYDPTNLPKEPQSNPSNFAGPLWRTYSPLMPDYVQKSIATKRVEEVDRTYQYLRQILDQNLIGTRYTLRHNGGVVVSNLDPIMECTSQRDCLCINSPEDPNCQNEDIEDLRKAFPDTFEEVTDEYLRDLKRQIVARIYAGVQQSSAFPTDMTTSLGTGKAGPLSTRSFGQCKIDLDNDNSFFGKSESVTQIVSSALQSLNDVSEDTQPDPEKVREAITSVTSEIVGKILPINWLNKQYEKRTTRAYIVLPDEALDIDIAQAYITPMFLSPTMYESIMKGENPIYPFNLDEQGNPKPEQEKQVLSAFLRTIGLNRAVEPKEEEGYVLLKRTQYASTCVDPANCQCTSDVISESPSQQWVEFNSEFEAQQPTIENGCVKEEIDQESFIDLRNSPDGKSPDANPQVPGQLQALNEFLRRAAFTPHHLQAYTVYPGLEMFYQGTGTSGLQPSEVGNFPVSGDCRYKEPRQITPSIKNNAELSQYICSVAGDPNMAALTLAIWRIEGGRARNSIDLGGSTSYTCGPNRSGAIPPMNFVIGICSDGRIPADFRRELNTPDAPDLCDVRNALTLGIQKIRGDFSFVSRQNSALSTSNPAQLKELFARASHLYIGTGYNCGDYKVDDDGAPLSGGGGLDYCGYAAVRAMEYLADLPASCR